ncbi:hypothetical protein Xbed_03619 [Xenorhabdus beddingii]|uniref:Uncharacterized protein n=1 Tax=Xenorhabdus beddingii TaxID=40578 RepID=A0A1Y2SB77_9GAMM|nr:hypothetical protein Xbed_03619 [Xenorhabdus beddingii]
MENTVLDVTDISEEAVIEVCSEVGCFAQFLFIKGVI